MNDSVLYFILFACIGLGGWVLWVGNKNKVGDFFFGFKPSQLKKTANVMVVIGVGIVLLNVFVLPDSNSDGKIDNYMMLAFGAIVGGIGAIIHTIVANNDWRDDDFD